MSISINTSEFIPDEIAMMGKKYVKKWQAAELNSEAFRDWYDFLRQAAISCFKWEGIPDGIDSRFIEWSLYTYGMGAFFKNSYMDTVEDYMYGQCAPRSHWNLYHNPLVVEIYAPNQSEHWTRHTEPWADEVGGVYKLRDADAVICYDNLLRKTLAPTLMRYARRIADIDRTVDINMAAQKTPYLLQVPEQQRKDAINLYTQITGNEPAILASDIASDMLGVSAVQTLAPYVADKLMVDQMKIINQVYTMLGIDNSNVEKRERMIDAEATSNNEQIMAARLGRLEARRIAARQLSKMWNMQIEVEWAIPHIIEAGEGSETFDESGASDDYRD